MILLLQHRAEAREETLLEAGGQVLLAPDLHGERLRLVLLAVRQMYGGEHGHAGGAARFAVLEVGGDDVGVAAFLEQRLFHAPLQLLAARPVGVVGEELQVVGGLPSPRRSRSHSMSLRASGIAEAGLEIFGLGQFAGGQRLEGGIDLRGVFVGELVVLQRRYHLVELSDVGGFALLRREPRLGRRSAGCGLGEL